MFDFRAIFSNPAANFRNPDFPVKVETFKRSDHTHPKIAVLEKGFGAQNPFKENLFWEKPDFS